MNFRDFLFSERCRKSKKKADFGRFSKLIRYLFLIQKEVTIWQQL
jgi:hypothetical protein